MQQQQHLVFIGGLPRSGTGLLTTALAMHPLISGFQDKSMSVVAGPQLPSVQSSPAYGETGEFGFLPPAHLTEASPLVTKENGDRLLAEWVQYWDLAKPVLLEEAPQNLIRTRFLQALFPEASFIIITRHPIAVALATGKFSVSRVNPLIQHWLVCHEWFEQDCSYLRRLHLLTYEELVERPQATLDGVYTFLGLPPHQQKVETGAARRRHARYLSVWSAMMNSPDPSDHAEPQSITYKYGSRVRKFGYDLGASDSRLPGHCAVPPPSATSQTRSAPGGPDFLILGAQKAGTSALSAYLIEHPDVVPPFRKELNFFNYGSMYRRGIELYREYFPQRALGAGGTPRITGEATPHYLFHPRVPRLVAEHFPHVKLLVLLRNPVDRAYSHYQMVLRLTGDERLSFEEAIDAEAERLRGEAERMLADPDYDSKAHRRYSYLARGAYFDQLMRWTEFFPREQMLILRSEDLLVHPVATLDRVHQFLGLAPREPTATRFANAYAYPALDPSTRAHLVAYFAPHNRRLYDYLGTNFEWR